MDIRDIQPESVPKLVGKSTLKGLWDLQMGLVTEYIRIEKLPQYPVRLDLKSNQIMLKDFIGRVIEELAEGHEHDLAGHQDLYQEELADALHFILELAIFTYPSFEAFERDIMAHYPHKYVGSLVVCPPRPEPNTVTKVRWYWQVTYHLKIAANALKNKPWKQTQMRTREEEFFRYFSQAFYILVRDMWKCGLSNDEEMYNMYYRKNAVNKFRQKSKY